MFRNGLKVFLALLQLMRTQKTYVVFMFPVSIKYKICQVITFKIKKKKIYIYRAGELELLILNISKKGLLMRLRIATMGDTLLTQETSSKAK